MVFKFIDEFFRLPHLVPTPVLENEEELPSPDDQDFMKKYSLCLLKYDCTSFLWITRMHSRMVMVRGLLHCTNLKFWCQSLPGFHAYAIEMVISAVQHYFCPMQKPFIASGPLQLTGKEVLEKTLRLIYCQKITT